MKRKARKWKVVTKPKDENDVNVPVPEDENETEEKEEKKMSKGKKIGVGIAAGATVIGALIGGFLLGKKSYADPHSDDDFEEFEDRTYAEVNPQDPATEDTAD